MITDIKGNFGVLYEWGYSKASGYVPDACGETYGCSNIIGICILNDRS